MDDFVFSGDRIKYLRLLLNFSRAKFSEKYGIPITTLRKWESSKDTSSSDKAALTLVKLLHNEINLTLEWTKHGDGELPCIKENSQYDFQDLSSIFEDSYKFIERFGGQDLVLVTIPNNDWKPWLSSGDIIIACNDKNLVKNKNIKIVTSSEGIRYFGFIVEMNDKHITLSNIIGETIKITSYDEILTAIQIRYL